MAKHNEQLVIAEILLSHPKSSAVDKVTNFLQEKGVQISSVGTASISIRCDQPTFEKLFHARLKKAQQPASRKGVKDYGPLKHDVFQSEQPIVVPSEIADEVEGVYLQEPAKLF